MMILIIKIKEEKSRVEEAEKKMELCGDNFIKRSEKGDTEGKEEEAKF